MCAVSISYEISPEHWGGGGDEFAPQQLEEGDNSPSKEPHRNLAVCNIREPKHV